MTGAFTEIVGIVAPSSAKYGDVVSVQVQIKNLWTGAFYIAVSGNYGISFSPDYSVVEVGATHTFIGSLTMPNQNITLEVWSWYWTGTEWIHDDTSYVDISLTGLVSAFSELAIASFSKV